ncbi:MAG: hypothetical protein KGQ95_05590, partial [Acidobacteria bacterium]|nr:hypothetical protein [Acidobacteriota bacterium]
MRPRAALLLAVPVLLACAAAAFAASWQLPATTLSAPGEQGREPAVVADGSGVVTAVWSPLVGVAGPVRASRFANGEWSAAASLSNPDTSANTASLVADSAGVITAVWSVQRGDDYVIQAARYAQGSWGAAQDISAAGGNARYPTAAVDSSGVVTVVWERVVGSTSVIQAARYANGAWSSTADIATASTTAGTYAVPDVAVDGAGVVTAVWVASSVGQSTVTAARYSGGIWSAPQALSSGGPPDIARQPQVAANASGSVIAVWQQFVTPNYKVAASRFTGGAWSAASVIAGSASAVTEFPQVVVDASGVATTIWQQGTLGATVIRASRDSGVGWGPPV